MALQPGDDDTICALSTPPGVGGIAVIRVSGTNAAALTRRVCPFLPAAPQSHRIYYGFLKSPERESIDEVLVSFFSAGRSFTGDETTEISCHGGPVVVSAVLAELVKAGCRNARPGEFTYRAFMNGRIDLVQAESILGLIESQSRQAAKVAIRQLEGHLSIEFGRIESELLWVLAQLEASIDFSTEDIQVADLSLLSARTSKLVEAVDELIGTYQKGRVIREGVQVALVGAPNVGKSSLLNALLREDRAIVAEEAGTTRDLVEGRVGYAGLPVTFVDTAGLRETENAIEKIGIQKTLATIGKSDFVFYVFDLSRSNWMADFHQAEFDVKDVQTRFVFNKVDLDPGGLRRDEALDFLESRGVPDRAFWVSARTGQGISDIERFLSSLGDLVGSEQSNIITQSRHVELLQKIQSCLTSALRLMRENSSPEFIAFELQDSVRAVHELLGKEFHEQVIDRIFKEFCLGK